MKMTKKLFFLIYFFLIGFISGQAHPFYVSICQIDFNSETHSLEISVKTFADDLLQALEKEGATKIYLGEEKENPATNELIYNYLKSHLSLNVNGEKVAFKFIGKEMETDAVWSYLEIDNISELNEIEVNCTLLTEIFDSQNNIIQISKGEGIKSMLLDRKKNKDSITF